MRVTYRSYNNRKKAIELSIDTRAKELGIDKLLPGVFEDDPEYERLFGADLKMVRRLENWMGRLVGDARGVERNAKIKARRKNNRINQSSTISN